MSVDQPLIDPALTAQEKDGTRDFLDSLGPGLLVMLAGTDAGSIMTAAQSGAELGYSLLLFQLAIFPVLYLVQELALRLALGTGRGMGELIRRRFGSTSSIVIIVVLAVSCLGSLVTQLSGLAAVGQLLGAPVLLTVATAVIGVSVMALSGSYQSVEGIALFFGAFEIVFIYTGWRSHPDLNQMVAGLGAGTSDPRYLYLLAANLGTTLMPWAIFYQQSAAVDKGLTIANLRFARIETWLGALFCQIVTCGLMITAAKHAGGQGAVPEGVQAFSRMFASALGSPVGSVLFGAGLMGGALTATVVVCLTCAWAFGEATGLNHSLEHHPRDAPWFYASLVAMLVLAGLFVASGVDLVKLSIAAGVINALLLPIVLLALFLLARSELTGTLRPSGAKGFAIALVLAAISMLGLYAGVVGAFG